MTDYFVDPVNGNDGNAGTSWAQAKLTLNGAEDIPVVAGDDVYCGPGVYRETLTVDVNGSAGNPITYIADVTGENTDGIGGPCRITGSDDDLSATRASCISSSGKIYRTFRGFQFDMFTGDGVGDSNDPTNWIIEDCVFINTGADSIDFAGSGQANCTIRRCWFLISIATCRS